MATFSSKHEKRLGLVDPTAVLVGIALISILVVLGLFTNGVYNSSGVLGVSRVSISSGDNLSFATDEQYWGVNCSHGWDSDSVCDLIVSKAQSCEISTASVYCSEYHTYMQRFRN